MLGKSELFSVGTGIYALATITNILSVIILILSILNILWGMGYKIYQHFKNKKFQEISNELEEAKNELEELKNNDRD